MSSQFAKIHEILGDRSQKDHHITVSEVLPFLYVGTQDEAKDMNLLKQKGITQILNSASHDIKTGDSFYSPHGIKYSQVPEFVVDDPTCDVKSCFRVRLIKIVFFQHNIMITTL